MSLAIRRPGILLCVGWVAWTLSCATLCRAEGGRDSFDPAAGEQAPLSSAPAAEVEPAAESQPSDSSPATQPETRTERRIRLLTEHYLRLYGKQLKSEDWIVRAMALIGLSRIDDPRTTDKLVEVLNNDPAAIVRGYAWECLHARLPDLTNKQRRDWDQAAVYLADKNALRGHLRAGLVSMVGGQGPTPENKTFFARMFEITNLENRSDFTTLRAMRAVLADWKDPDLIQGLIEAMTRLNDAWRAEYLLGGLGAKVDPADKYRDLGSQVMWQRAASAWVAWFQKADLKPSATGQAASKHKVYRGRSDLVPAPRKMTDPDDPFWRRNLELGRLQLDQLDVSFVVDTTGSMGEVLGWLRRDVLKMMRSFGMIAREPRVGVIAYRDHGDDYVVKPLWLTDDGKALIKCISGLTAQGGGVGDVPEAVSEGLEAALTGQQWSSGQWARKVVVLIGDAPPHEETLPAIQKLMEAAVKESFRVYCVKVKTRYAQSDLTSFDRIAKWGGGDSVWIELAQYDRAPRDKWIKGPSNLIVEEAVRGILNKEYHDLVGPFVNVLMEYTDSLIPERRSPFGAKSKAPPPPRPRPPPKDPQAR